MSSPRSHPPRPFRTLLAAVCLLSGWGGAALAADPVKLTLKDHRFTPEQVQVPAGERFEIVVTNQDSTASEFESSDLKVEKIVAGGDRITVRAGPLRPGTYKFFDDYHPNTAKGTIVAVAPGKG